VWSPEPRNVITTPLDAIDFQPAVRVSEPVVEASLLTGPQGSALVLVNYTYKPIASLRVTIKPSHKIKQVISTEGSPVKLHQKTAVTLRGEQVEVKASEGYQTIELPLEWTDIVMLPNP
jgi:hypothetical protein